jgi:ATP-dependent DNA ligase
MHKIDFQLPRGRNLAVVSRLSKPIFLCAAASTRGLALGKDAAIFRKACAMGPEGIVSKPLSAPYRSGPSRDWIKVKNPDSLAMTRTREAERR